MKGMVGFDRIVINLIDTAAQTFMPVYIAGIEIKERSVGKKLPLEGIVTQLVVNSGQSFLEETIEDHEAITADRSHIVKLFDSSISVPLRTKGRISSTLHLQSKTSGAYGTHEMAIVERYADRIAPAIENARLHEETQRQAAEVSVMAEIGRIVNSSLEIDEVYQRIGSEFAKLIDFDRLSVSVIDQENETVVNTFVTGIEIPGLGAGQIFELSDTSNGSANITQLIQPWSEEDLPEQVPVIMTLYQAGLKSFMVVPLVSQGEMVAVLRLQSTAVNAYSNDDVRVVELIGAHIAQAIENARLHEEAIRQAEETSSVAEIGRTVNGGFGHRINLHTPRRTNTPANPLRPVHHELDRN
jgi:GAF domain-containing protein